MKEEKSFQSMNAIPLTRRGSLRQRIGHFTSQWIQNRWVNIGLRAKMSLLVEVGLVGLIAIFLFLGISAARQANQQILNERMTLARLSASALDATLQHAHSVLALTADNAWLNAASMTSSKSSLEDELSLRKSLDKASLQIGSVAQGIYLLNLAGVVQNTSSLAIPIEQQLLPGGPALQSNLQTPGLPSLLPGEPPRAFVVVPVFDRARIQTGWLAAILDFSVAELVPFHTKVELGKAGTLDLVDPAGRVLASSRPQTSNPLPQKVVDRLFVAGQPAVETCLGCTSGDSVEVGENEVIAFAPLNQAPWGILVRQDADDLMAPVNRLLLQTLLLGAITVLGALILVWVTTNSVIRPVQALQEAAEQITAGNLDATLDESSACWSAIENIAAVSLPRRSILRLPFAKDVSPANQTIGAMHAEGDEIGALAASFARMCRYLKHSIEEIQTLNRELDVRVQERTQAARQAQLQAQAAGEILLRRNRQLAILNAIATTVNQSLDLQDILERSLEAVIRLTEVDVGAVFLKAEVDDQQGSLRLMAQRGLSEEAARIAAEIGMLDGACGGVTELGQMVIVPDVSHYRSRRARSLHNEQICTLVHIPLTVRGYTLGSLCIGTRQSHDYDPEEQEMMDAIGSQIAVSIENARLYAEVQHKERLRGELLRKALSAQEDERKRIARELHDDTSQALTALIYAAEEAQEMKSLAAARKRLAGMHDLLQHTLDGVHKLIFDLRPSILDHLGLLPAVHWLAKTRLEARGLRVTFDETGADYRFPPEIETGLFRVIQEAIGNIARHSAARNVSIVYQADLTFVRVVISDDGIGFDLESFDLKPDSPRGLGLLNMRERLELLGGELWVDSHPGAGAVVEIHIPLTTNCAPDLNATHRENGAGAGPASAFFPEESEPYSLPPTDHKILTAEAGEQSYG